MKIWSLVSTALLALAGLSATGAAVGKQASLADGVVTAEAVLGSRRIAARIDSRSVVTREAIGEAASPGQYPPSTRIIRAIQITVNGTPIHVPRSTFSDVLGAREAAIESDPRRLALVIKGGDGSEAYVLRIEFDDKAVRRRLLMNPAIPGKPLEETTYLLRVMPDK
jgi:hypothetical protein